MAGRIIRLPDDVVNRIAAGEVIQRPANAIKELVENSLDAGARCITVTVSEGGLKSFCVQDDGHGIRFEDLPILCERHTTSKLEKYEDLSHIATFGFRGEALASISHVANVTVTTMTANQACAYKAHYFAGVYENGKNPIPCAGNRGTIIVAEHLFFNLKQRREALKNPTEEMRKILHVIQRYALHFHGVCFSLKKLGSSTPELHTQKDASLEATIAALFGNDVEQNLLRLNVSNDEYCVKVQGRITSANYVGKNYLFSLFVNNRLVDCPSLKRSVKDVYGKVLSKGRHPFVYLNVQLKPENVDVNVHPTKQIVRFRYEEEIIRLIEDAIQDELRKTDVSRPFMVSSQASSLPDVRMMASQDKSVREFNDPDDAAWRLVRVDSREQKLEQFLVRSTSSQSTTNTKRSLSQELEEPQFHQPAVSELKQKKRKTALTSIAELIDQYEQNHHVGLAEFFKEFTFVGCIDANRVLLQHRLMLYMVNAPAILSEFFYQVVLEGWQGFEPLHLSNPPSVDALIRLALEGVRSKVAFKDLPESEQNNLVSGILKCLTPKRREMWKTYLAFEVSDDLKLISIPCVLSSFTPDLTRLPRLMWRMLTKVSYASEKECFQQISKELADFFAPPTMQPAFLPDDATDDEIEERRLRSFVMENVLFHALKGFGFKPSIALSRSGDISSVVSLDHLYKTFERC